MKTSNKLLILLFALSIFLMIGSGFSLKAKFEKIDRKDPYFGYSSDLVKPFKYIKLTGNFFGYTQIEPGKKFEVRMSDFRSYSNRPDITWKVIGDTLNVNYKTSGQQSSYNGNIFIGAPHVYIIAPELSGVHSIGLMSKIQGWKNGAFSVEQKGHGVLFSNNHFSDLSINVQSGGNVKIEGQNLLGNTSVLVKDSSNLTADKDVFKTFGMKIDSAAYVSLPGSLVTKTSKL